MASESSVEAAAVAIGGMVLDIHATPSISTNPRTTVPGKVQYVIGGVARNIAECMSKLGTKPYMISAVGNDMAGNLLLEYWNSAGLLTEGIQKSQKIRTPVISNIFDSHGELVAGVADVEAVEKFVTPEWILQSTRNIYSASVYMVDANLATPALEAACQAATKYSIPIWFEPVSVTKSVRIASIASNVTFASPNEDELVAMANSLSCGNIFSPINRDEMNNSSAEHLFRKLKPAIMVLLDKGIKIVIVTLGAKGLLLCAKEPNLMKIRLQRTKRHVYSGSLHHTVSSSCPPGKFSGGMQSNGSSHLKAIHFPSLPSSVVRLTGAGDCLVGGTLACLCAGLDVAQSVAVGIAVAKTAVEAESNVPSAFDLASVADDARMVYSAAKLLFQQSML